MGGGSTFLLMFAIRGRQVTLKRETMHVQIRSDLFFQGMEYLIKEAFLHVADLGPHVAEGQYDLLGPKDEIIMPSIWESVIEPGWEITMHMWPLPEPPPEGGDALAEGVADIVIVEPGVPPPPPSGRLVDGVPLPLKEQPVIHADFDQKRKARKKRKGSRHSWPGLRASQKRSEQPLKARRSEAFLPPCLGLIMYGSYINTDRAQTLKSGQHGVQLSAFSISIKGARLICGMLSGIY